MLIHYMLVWQQPAAVSKEEPCIALTQRAGVLHEDARGAGLQNASCMLGWLPGCRCCVDMREVANPFQQRRRLAAQLCGIRRQLRLAGPSLRCRISVMQCPSIA